MSARSWAQATVDLLLAAAGLYVVVFPALSVAVALVTGESLGAGPSGFVAGLLVTIAAGSLLGLALLSRVDVALPSPLVARAAILGVAYPVATAVAFGDRFRLDPTPPTVPEE